MAKAFSPDELVARTFYITMGGIAMFVAAVFIFVL
jgi:hypothetical protein